MIVTVRQWTLNYESGRQAPSPSAVRRALPASTASWTASATELQFWCQHSRGHVRISFRLPAQGPPTKLSLPLSLIPLSIPSLTPFLIQQMVSPIGPSWLLLPLLTLSRPPSLSTTLTFLPIFPPITEFRFKGDPHTPTSLSHPCYPRHTIDSRYPVPKADDHRLALPARPPERHDTTYTPSWPRG